MLNKIKQFIFAGRNSSILQAAGDINVNQNIPTALVDEKTEDELQRLWRSRFFPEFERASASLSLGTKLIEGELMGASDLVKGRALARCSRVLSGADKLDKAEEYFVLAKALGEPFEAKIAEAALCSRKKGKAHALALLADIGSNDSRTSSLMITAHHEGQENSLHWMEECEYTASELNSDGVCFLLEALLQLRRWDEARLVAESMLSEDFEKTPMLHSLVATTKLMLVIPVEFRPTIRMQTPLDLRGFPLAAGPDSMLLRTEAIKHFEDGACAAYQLNCTKAAQHFDTYALWLKLRDPAKLESGKKLLESYLRDPDRSLGFVLFGIQFGFKPNIDLVEQNIARTVAINGGATPDTAVARFSIALMQPNTEDIVSYIELHRGDLAGYIDEKLLLHHQLEMLLKDGLIDRANEVVDRLLNIGLSEEEEGRVRGLIEEVGGVDPVERRKKQYESTKAIVDLLGIVTELEARNRWGELCKYCKLLYEGTGSLGDAERLVNAYNETFKSRKIVSFFEENQNLLQQSTQLSMSYAWALYQEGKLLESRVELEKLAGEKRESNYRAIFVNLGIASGDWNSLSTYIAEEYAERAYRSASELIEAARLAFHLRAPQAKDLVYEAAEKGRGDAEILTTAYLLATNAGWEVEDKVSEWLALAVELSEDSGPLQKIGIKDVLDLRPEWARRESETHDLLARNQIPIFVAAHSLNRTLIECTTFPLLSNLGETDPRKKSGIPSYSGKRLPLKLDFSGKTVILDVTAMLTLSFLNVLSLTFNSFEKVCIPHSTLKWLLEERQKATFHQPSRVAAAREVRDLLAAGDLMKLDSDSIVSNELSSLIGCGLALLITEARRVRENDNSQHIVVRSSPVFRVSSMREEEANLSDNKTVLSSCMSIVRKLKQKGVITSNEEKRAETFLSLSEKPWPNQPIIEDGSSLYLDDLSVTYLQHLGLLGKLKVAGLTGIVSSIDLAEVDALLSYDRLSDEVSEVIERLREALKAGIDSGHISVGARSVFDEKISKSISDHPSAGILSLVSQCDLAVVDDRFINKHLHLSNDESQATIYSTLDLLDALVMAGAMSQDDCLEHRTRLRRGGYFFVSVNVEETVQCLSASPITNGQVVETAELKAIRESVNSVWVYDRLTLPEDAPWLDETLKVLITSLRHLWNDEGGFQKATARSNWLVRLINIRRLARSFISVSNDLTHQPNCAAYILLLLIPLVDVEQSVSDAYSTWVEEEVFAVIQEEFPEFYQWLVEWHFNELISVTESNLWKDGAHE